jgi:putative glycosyltransferase (TIGR04372 family)
MFKEMKHNIGEWMLYLIRKIRILLFAPLALFIHMVSPLLLIRIGAIYSERVGHLGLDLELSMCYEKSRKQRFGIPKKLDLFYLTGSVSNTYLLKLWKEKLIILPKWLLNPIHRLNHRLPAYNKYNYFDWVQKSGHKDMTLFDQYPSTLSIPASDLERGRKLLKDLGIAPNQPYICLAVRDSGYLDQQQPNVDWSTHDYRDSKIENYLEMAEYLVTKGFAVLRMGQIMKGSFDSEDPSIIDYANSPLQSDFADVFLFSSCIFCISTSTGMDSLATIFRVPTGLVNIANIDSVSTGELVKIFQPKEFIEQRTGKALSYQEILDRDLFRISSTSDFGEKGVILVENSPEDLKLFAKELLEILALGRAAENIRTESRPALTGEVTIKGRIDKLSKSWLLNHQMYLK